MTRIQTQRLANVAALAAVGIILNVAGNSAQAAPAKLATTNNTQLSPAKAAMAGKPADRQIVIEENDTPKAEPLKVRADKPRDIPNLAGGIAKKTAPLEQPEITEKPEIAQKPEAEQTPEKLAENPPLPRTKPKITKQQLASLRRARARTRYRRSYDPVYDNDAPPPSYYDDDYDDGPRRLYWSFGFGRY